MSLRQLHHFTILAEEGSFVAAARRLNLTQSALSHSINALEEQLGIILVDRSKSGTKLTQAGTQVLKDAVNVVRQEATLRQNALALARKESGEARFGFAPLPAHLWLADILSFLINDYPGITASASVSSIDTLLMQLQKDAIEFFICGRILLENVRGLDFETLTFLPLSFLTRRDHPLQEHEEIKLEILKNYTIARIATDFNSITEAEIYHLFRNIVQCNDCSALRELTLKSDVIWLSTERAVSKMTDGLATLTLPLKDVPAQTEFIIVSHAGRTISPAGSLVIEATKKLASSSRRPMRGWA